MQKVEKVLVALKNNHKLVGKKLPNSLLSSHNLSVLHQKNVLRFLSSSELSLPVSSVSSGIPFERIFRFHSKEWTSKQNTGREDSQSQQEENSTGPRNTGKILLSSTAVATSFLFALFFPKDDEKNFLGEMGGKILKTVKQYKVISFLFFGISGITLVLYILIYLYQRKLMYFPLVEYDYTPKDFALKLWEDVWLETKDGVTLHGWFIKHIDAQEVPTIVHFHGNAGNISHRLDLALKLGEMKCNVFLVSYRGYGKSGGKPSEKGLLLDAEAAIEHTINRNDIDKKKIFLYGASLGGAVAIDAANKFKTEIQGLILENTFSSFRDMMKVVLPSLRHFTFLLRDSWRSDLRIADVPVPILFVSGSVDSIVPPRMMEQLFALAISSPLKEINRIKKGDHNDTWMQPEFVGVVSKFIDQVLYQKQLAS